MKQSSYDTIVACIQHGAAATANQLIEELNGIVNDSNQLRALAQEVGERAKELRAEPTEEKENVGE
jgi:hypothetical protein